MRAPNDGGRVLDPSAHLLSRAIVSQWASVTCYTLVWTVVLFVTCEYCVYSMLCECHWIVTARKAALAVTRFCTDRPERWCMKYSVTSTVKQARTWQLTALPDRKNVLPKHAIWVLRLCKELLVRETSRCALRVHGSVAVADIWPKTMQCVEM